MNKLNQMITAAANGIRRPYTVMRVADDVGIPFHVLCAFLMKESSGGRNIFGHDAGRPFYGAGRVTKRKYLAYKKERDLSSPKRMQGVGPMQLTWWEFQDRADELGGCWKPRWNMTVGAQIIKDYWDDYHNWTDVGERYNGRRSYGIEIDNDIKTWARRLDILK